MSAMTPIRILLTDDHAVLQAGLAAMLNAEPDMRVVGTASDGRECIRQAVMLSPDLILLDVNMPHCNGLEALAELRVKTPASKVLILTMHDDVEYLRHVMTQGASGFVLKQAAGEELLAAIRAVYRGGIYLHPAHAHLLMQPPTAPAPEPVVTAGRLADLSQREVQIFKLIALGYRNSDIADELSLSVKTVETYKSRLMQKLGFSSRIEIVRYALDIGLLENPPSPPR
jgi:two-component system, NarL family, response regulator NreC